MRLTEMIFYDRAAFRLSNKWLSLTIVPALGGRVMELIADGQNYLWINQPLLEGRAGGDPHFGGWKNWGGYKTWLAPQDQWPNPDAQPDKMDNGRWEVTARTDSGIELWGPVIPWGGVRLGRSIALDPGQPKVVVRESIQNMSSGERRWGIWAVAQFPTPGWAKFFTDSPKRARRLHERPPSFEGDRIRFAGDAKWKIGVIDRTGEAEYCADGWPRSFHAGFAPHMFQPHPDACNLEAWSNTAPAYMELEWLGPMVVLKPEESWTFETAWRLV